MKFFYDFHIHSDLSPCGDKDMTPNNIVNMAYIKGLNMIAVTDHNTIENYKAIEKIAQGLGILVVPGIEINTKEEVHILSYFKDYKSAKAVSDLIYESLPNILLISASKYSIGEICTIVNKYNGVIVPAHINKKSNGILGVLGFFPTDINFEFIEISKSHELGERNKKMVMNYKKLVSSDAHILENISEPINYINLEKLEDIYSYLNIN